MLKVKPSKHSQKDRRKAVKIQALSSLDTKKIVLFY